MPVIWLQPVGLFLLLLYRKPYNVPYRKSYNGPYDGVGKMTSPLSQTEADCFCKNFLRHAEILDSCFKTAKMPTPQPGTKGELAISPFGPCSFSHMASEILGPTG